MERIIFKRKIYKRMLEWKVSSAGSTALLIKGARRVGKSTIAREFASREYDSYIEIDFARTTDEVRGLFDDIQDIDFLFFRLQQIFKTTLVARKSVIVFDEIQKCPKARQAIKYLVEDGRYDYIETGSLISIRKNTKDILIPSEETRLSMYPMDYEEFLAALGDVQTWPLLEYCYDNHKAIPEKESRSLLKDFRLYMIVGGMPQAVKRYLETNDLAAVDSVKRSIIELYLDDFEKIDPTGRISMIFRNIPSELSKSKLKYELGTIDDNARYSNTLTLLRELEESMTVNFCWRCSDPNVGLGLHKDSENFKLYMGDTGLFITLAFWDKEQSDNVIYTKLLADRLSADLGYVFENVVSQILRASGHSLYYYTFPAREDMKKHYEVDFLLTARDKLIPVEVKSSGYKAHKSLDAFCEKFSSRVEYPMLISPKPYRREGSLLMLPVYMTPLL